MIVRDREGGCRLAAVLAFASLWASGCATRLVVRAPEPLQYAQAGPAVRVLPFKDQRPAPLHVSVAYIGLFQSRNDFETHAETPPALVLAAALEREMAARGLSDPRLGTYEVGCRLDQFLIRLRNYAGAYSGTDSWGYLDLACRVSSSGQMIWEGPIHARFQHAGYVAFSSFQDVFWPVQSGALVQQVAATLNRHVFHLRAAPEVVKDGSALLVSATPAERERGAYLLGVTGDPGVVPLLVSHLGDPDKDVRRAVVDALGTLGARETLPALLASYDAEEGVVQWAIIKTILQCGAPEGLFWLKAHRGAIKADTLREIVDDVLATGPG